MTDILKRADYAARVAKAKATREKNMAAKREMQALYEEDLAAKQTRLIGEPELPDPVAPQAPIRQASRTRADGRVEVTGRNGEVLSRTHIQVGDPFEIPADKIPKGWVYQWNSLDILGNSDILASMNHGMYLNGWRPVPAERYAGSLVPAGSSGNIIRGRMILVERPKALNDEAKAEDERNARQLVSDRNESLKMAGVKKGLPSGFEMSKNQYRGTGGDITMKIDPGLDIPRPKYDLADDE